MFQSLKNIQTSFSLMRVILITVIISCTVICVSAVFFSYRFAEAQRQKIYVLDNGKSLILALSRDVNTNRLAEARSHVKRFHEFFFTLSPNKENIEYNIHQALPLADNSALTAYRNLEENSFYNNLIAASASQEVRIDSVVVDINSYPYNVRTYGKTSIIRSSNITVRNLVTESHLRNISRSDSNPHGFLIENWRVLNNETIKTCDR